MALQSLLDAAGGTQDTQTRGFIARALVLTICLIVLGTMGTVLYLAATEQTIPTVLTALLSSLVGATVLGLGAHSSAAIVSDAVGAISTTTQIDAARSSADAQAARVARVPRSIGPTDTGVAP